jgi:hypothetical protein
MWTFTFVEVHEVKDAVGRWQLCLHQLRKVLGFYGVRSFELHPGGHGLHIHVATSGSFRVEQVYEIAKQYGFGRIDVRWKTRDRLSYVAKEISKNMKARGWAYRRRVWAAFGSAAGWVKTRCRDVEFTGPMSAAMDNQRFRGWRGLGLIRRARREYLAEWTGVSVLDIVACKARFLWSAVADQRRWSGEKHLALMA